MFRFLIAVNISFSCLIILVGQKVITLEKVEALTMSGGNYILEMGTLDSFSGEASGENNKLNFTSGEAQQGASSGTNNSVKLGFQYIHPLRGFSFSVSQSQIDFGLLSPTNPVTRNAIVSISNRSAQGYSVSASEDHPLRVSASGQIIPDTTCDNGGCSDTASSTWSNALTYGFGYRCDTIGTNDCASGFTSDQSYKQFADESLGESPQAIMAGATNGQNRQVKITYKVNVAGSQAPGSYQNTITFIAVPSF